MTNYSHCGTDKNRAIFEHLFNCKTCQNSDIVQNFKVLKRCKQSELYSLESIFIEEEQPNLKMQIALSNFCSKSGNFVEIY